MSSFNRQGLRQTKLQENKKVKAHIKGFYDTLGKMEDTATQLLSLDVSVTEDNISEHASKILGREIDDMEKFLLLGKLSIKNEDNTIKD